jgi:hypothetical protein
MDKPERLQCESQAIGMLPETNPGVSAMAYEIGWPERTIDFQYRALEVLGLIGSIAYRSN